MNAVDWLRVEGSDFAEETRGGDMVDLEPSVLADKEICTFSNVLECQCSDRAERKVVLQFLSSMSMMSGLGLLVRGSESREIIPVEP